MTNETLDAWRNQYIGWLEVNWLQKDGAHDMDHLHRVWRNCRKLNAGEGDKADQLILLTAAYFHDLVTLPKNHPDRSGASLQSADKIAELLRSLFDFPQEKIEGVHHAIHAHSFSANINTRTLESKILQDADRIEALGATGVARLFYIAGKMDTSLYHSDDPLGTNRKLDDKRYALDHIELKLLTLPDTMKTTSGRELAKKEAAYVVSFRQKLLEEI